MRRGHLAHKKIWGSHYLQDRDHVVAKNLVKIVNEREILKIALGLSANFQNIRKKSEQAVSQGRSTTDRFSHKEIVKIQT